ncbi:hypothetical protein [Streptomyces sp. NPDC048106]|uniref:hypothetical protein n=1 Tax=Streptomyces sp. NPDC048106 TaxID=3155750 RepID=UPI0034517D34
MTSRSSMPRHPPAPVLARGMGARWHSRVRELGRTAISPATGRRPEPRRLTVTSEVQAAPARWASTRESYEG